MATARTAKSTSPAEPDAPREDDGVPSFTTEHSEVEYNGPVLMRIDGVEYRMRTERTFAGSLLYLRRLRNSGVRDAELALVEYAAGAAATNRIVTVAELDQAAWHGVVQRAADHVFGKSAEDEGGN